MANEMKVCRFCNYESRDERANSEHEHLCFANIAELPAAPARADEPMKKPHEFRKGLGAWNTDCECGEPFEAKIHRAVPPSASPERPESALAFLRNGILRLSKEWREKGSPSGGYLEDAARSFRCRADEIENLLLAAPPSSPERERAQDELAEKIQMLRDAQKVAADFWKVETRTEAAGFYRGQAAAYGKVVEMLERLAESRR